MRVTVILAVVLFLIAIGQRFKVRGVRNAVNVVAGVLIVYCVYLIIVYPHIFDALTDAARRRRLLLRRPASSR